MSQMHSDHSASNIEIHIEELVLHGFRPAERYAIGEMVQRELTRLLAEQGVPPSLNTGAEIARLDGSAFDMQPGSKPETVGAQIAESVYQSIGRRLNR